MKRELVRVRDDKIRKMHENGHTFASIAARHGVCKTRVRQILASEAPPPPSAQRLWLDDRNRKMKEYFNSDYRITLQDVANKFELTRERVRQIVDPGGGLASARVGARKAVRATKEAALAERRAGIRETVAKAKALVEDSFIQDWNSLVPTTRMARTYRNILFPTSSNLKQSVYAKVNNLRKKYPGRLVERSRFGTHNV